LLRTANVLSGRADEVSTGIGPGLSEGDEAMIVDIYQSKKQPGKFILVQAGKDITDRGLAITDEDFTQVILHKSNVVLQPGIIGIDYQKAVDDLAEKNHHIFGSRVVVTVEIENS
jgi:hypothetical protein